MWIFFIYFCYDFFSICRENGLVEKVLWWKKYCFCICIWKSIILDPSRHTNIGFCNQKRQFIAKCMDTCEPLDIRWMDFGMSVKQDNSQDSIITFKILFIIKNVILLLTIATELLKIFTDWKEYGGENCMVLTIQFKSDRRSHI